MTDSAMTVDVAIVGGGPAGLMAANMLHLRGISAAVVETRSHHDIKTTQRAGILEAGTVQLLTEADIDSRVLTQGREHSGAVLSFEGVQHRIDFQNLVGRSVWLYPQNEIFVDLAAAWQKKNGQMFWSVSETRVHDLETDTPSVTFDDEHGIFRRIEAQLIIGADGSRSICRKQIPDDVRTDYFTTYPFAWFGILCEAPPTAPELIYANSAVGFALISQRNDRIQRMYFQCDPETAPDQWSDSAIFDHIQEVIGDGVKIKRGPIIEKTVLPFRSYVCDPLTHQRLVLVGDAGHTVPPTGAKGLNLAFADVRVLIPQIEFFLSEQNQASEDRLAPLRHYSRTALDRVWKAQNFSYWATNLLHREPEESSFTHQRRRGEFKTITDSVHGRAYFADSYTGWKH